MGSRVLEIKTMQSTAIKVLVEALKELLADTVIEVDPSGLKIVTMDNSRVVLVHLRLEAKRFEVFHCDTNRILGVNMLNLYKIMKTVGNNDTLTIFMESGDLNRLGISIQNADKNTHTTYNVNLLDVQHVNLSIPPAEFTSVVTLPSADFQKICRDMNNIADFMEIRNHADELIFSCDGDFCRQETKIRDSASVVDSDADGTAADHAVQKAGGETTFHGVYSLKYLVLFTKCTNLSNTVEIYMKNDYPLIVRYTVASLGDVKLCVCPVTHENS